jgi:WD40 repeat protein
MYRITGTIENDEAPSMVAEVSFHPFGSYFAATYENINEVRIFDSRTRTLLQALKNPESQLDHPHGILFTEKHLLIANTHNLQRPGTINVYRNSGAIKKPIQLFQSPFNHLREPHTLAVRDGRLVITYSENLAPTGAIVSYGFNEETGEITGPLDKTESWFSEYGDPKGICFNADGTNILVTFESDKHLSVVGKILLSFAQANNLTIADKVMKVVYQSINSLRGKIVRKGHVFNSTLKSVYRKNSSEVTKPDVELENPNRTYRKSIKNGIAIFAINAEGKIARSPDQVILRKQFCRLENIDMFEGTCVITDTVNRAVFLYDLIKDQKLKNPVQTINVGSAAPHGAKFSPNGKLLIISSLGLKIANQEIRFFDWESPREDKIIVCERAI